jgi:hypothetical protein
MPHERDISDLRVYGAEDFEELEGVLDAIDRALGIEADGSK